MIAVQNFLKSMQGAKSLEGQNLQNSNVAVAAITLLDLLPASATMPVIDAADEAFLDNLLSQLPPEIINSPLDNNPRYLTEVGLDVFNAEADALSFDRKKLILKRVLRSPQFSTSLISLTGALRDGGLPAISDALGIAVENGGYMHTGGLAMGGNDATGAFIEGIKDFVVRGWAKDRKQTLQ